MTHRVYVRWPDQRTESKTVTDDEAVARFAYDKLRMRSDLAGRRVGVTWTCNGKQQAFYDFSKTEGPGMSEPNAQYAADTPDARNRAALEVLESRVTDLEAKIDQLIAGQSVGVGITVDALAIQLATAQAAYALLIQKLSQHRTPVIV